MPIVLLKSQIDIDHWNVQFLNEEWKGMSGDYRFEVQGMEAGQKIDVSVFHYKKYKEPSTLGYCGKLEIKAKIPSPKVATIKNSTEGNENNESKNS